MDALEFFHIYRWINEASLLTSKSHSRWDSVRSFPHWMKRHVLFLMSRWFPASIKRRLETFLLVTERNLILSQFPRLMLLQRTGNRRQPWHAILMIRCPFKLSGELGIALTYSWREWLVVWINHALVLISVKHHGNVTLLGLTHHSFHDFLLSPCLLHLLLPSMLLLSLLVIVVKCFLLAWWLLMVIVLLRLTMREDGLVQTFIQ